MVACACGDNFASKATTRVKIQAAATMNDAYGGRSTGWIDEYERWAIVTHHGIREPFQSGQHQSRVTHKVTIRYIAALADTTKGAKRRLNLSGRTMNVVGVMNLCRDMKTEGTVYQTLLCVEGEPT